MHKIFKKIIIDEKVKLSKNSFINEEIGQFATIRFSCCKCGFENTIELIPYESGFPIFQIYNESQVLSISTLLEKRMVTLTSSWMQHLGELTVNDLPTLYFGIDCKNCESNYIGIFCYGEKQPGLTLLELSGVWHYHEKLS